MWKYTLTYRELEIVPFLTLVIFELPFDIIKQ